MAKKKVAKKTTKTVKKAKAAPKAAPAKSSKKSGRKQYSDAQKQEILNEIVSSGRGSVAGIAKKYGISLPTIYVWKRKVGGSSTTKFSAGKSSSSRTAAVARLLNVSQELDEVTSKLDKLNAEYAKLKKGL